MPQQLSSIGKRKPVDGLRAGLIAIAAACAAAMFGGSSAPAAAIVIPTPPPPPRVEPTSTPTGTPNSTVLPFDSSLFFVLDDTISSHTAPGTHVRAHLRDPIVLLGRTVVPAGTPVAIEVTQSAAAQVGNVDGSVEFYFGSLALPGGKSLPLSTPTARIDPHMTAGQESTRALTDTVGDIFIPGHFLYHILRKGADVTLRPGTVIRARTAAALTLAHGAVAVSTPAPFVTDSEAPHAAFSIAPLATPPGFQTPAPKRSPAAQPSPTPHRRKR